MDTVPRDTLARLVAENGVDLFDDARRLKAFLHDECPEHRRENALLVAVVEEGIALRLHQAVEEGHSGSQIELFARQLQEDRGLSPDAARWAVDTWFAVLDDRPTDAPQLVDRPQEPSPQRPSTAVPQYTAVTVDGGHGPAHADGPPPAAAGGVAAIPARPGWARPWIPVLTAVVIVALLVFAFAGTAQPGPAPSEPPTEDTVPTEEPSTDEGSTDPTTPVDEPTKGTDYAYLNELESECAGGLYISCDLLYRRSPAGSDYEDFGARCGNATAPRTLGECDDLYDSSTASTYGDDPYLDALQDLCVDGDMLGCDLLFTYSPIQSLYEEVGGTCNYLIPDASAAGACETSGT